MAYSDPKVQKEYLIKWRNKNRKKYNNFQRLLMQKRRINEKILKGA